MGAAVHIARDRTPGNKGGGFYPVSQRSGQSVGIFAAILTLAGWSVTPVFIGMLTGHIDAWTSNGWRYGLAALTWLPLLLVARSRGTLPPGLMKRALVPAAINAAAQTVFTQAFYLIDPTLVVIALRIQIVAAAIGAAIMFPGERAVIRTPMFLAGAGLATLGIVGVLVLRLGQVEVQASWKVVFGITLAVLAGIGYGGYALAVRRCMHGVSSPMAFAAIAQHTAVAMILSMLIFSPTHGFEVPFLAPGVLAILILSTYTGIAGTHVFYYITIKRLGVAVSTAVLQLQPFTVGIIAFFVMGEVLTIPQWACGLIAAGGAAMAIWAQHLKRRKPGSPPEEFAELPIDAVVASVIDERETKCH
jgi:drug/metabolite transporter (DMT)-like permease